MRQVWDAITQFHMLHEGDHVLIGVSGGPDSVALLHLLHKRAAQYGISLYVVHVHHMLRPEADEEAQYVETLAEQYGLPFRLYKVDVAEYAELHKISLEQAGHEVRFRCFLDAKSLWGINKLALGHHRDDRAESVLLHMVQGCGLDGLCAMPPADIWDAADGSMLIRPFAQVSKEALLAYCAEHELPYYIDATNMEPGCLRNQIRLELLPQMKAYNPQISDVLVRMQDSTGADLDYIETQVESLWQQHGSIQPDGVLFPAEVFRTQHIALQRRILRKLYRQWTGSFANLTFVQVEQMCSMAMESDGTKRLMLSDGVVFMRQYDLLCITTQRDGALEQETYHWEIAIQPEVHTCYGRFQAQWQIAPEEPAQLRCDAYTIWADADQLADMLTVRQRQSGDRVRLTNGGHKSVKKLFIDRKVPQPERHKIPLVVSGEEIVWIPGIYLSETIRTTGETKRICKLCFSRG